jgi:Eco57I restriction-modification methylase
LSSGFSAPVPSQAPVTSDGQSRRFCAGLRKCRDAAEASLPPIKDRQERANYLTAVLIRLMFLCFLQSRGLLNGDPSYLRRRLESSRQRGPDRFYHGVFLPLCFYGFRHPAHRERWLGAELAGLPYLSDGLFSAHAVEQALGLTPEALPAASRRDMPTIPDAVFAGWLDYLDGWKWILDEEDRRTTAELGPGILGDVFERSINQEQTGAHYTAADLAGYIATNTVIPRLLDMLPAAGGACCAGFSLPEVWKGKGADHYLFDRVRRPEPLPLESDRERRARREWRRLVRREFQAGRIARADDFITYNLDIRKLAEDLISSVPDPELLRIFELHCLRKIRILDPTCGSGGFLSTALGLLLRLRSTCRRRLEELGDCYPEGASTPEHLLCRSILEDNLFGVDLMKGAVETCRLRLCLHLLAHLPGGSSLAASPEPLLPDLRPNLRAGNAVAGCVRPEGLRGSRVDADPGSCRPFHWCLEFPQAMDSGGFDVVLGNPPYLDAATVRRDYPLDDLRTAECDNLYAPVMERSLQLLKPDGRLGMIVPISAISGPGYQPLMECVLRHNCWISSYSNRPGKLFPGVEQRLAVFLTGPSPAPRIRVAPYQHWYEPERPYLFQRLTYCEGSRWDGTGMPIKSGTPLAERVFARITRQTGRLIELTGEGEFAVWLHDGPTYWVRALAFEPNPESKSGRSQHYHRVPTRTRQDARVLAAVLSSSTFYFFFKMVSNCRDLGRKEWAEFPIGPLPPDRYHEMAGLGRELEERLRETKAVRSRVYPGGAVTYEEYYPATAKSILDRIDTVLARHYGFTDEERDFILHYEIKYRMGRNGG